MNAHCNFNDTFALWLKRSMHVMGTILLYLCMLSSIFALGAENLNFPGTPPSAVTNVTIDVQGPKSVYLSWPPSTDVDGGVPIYVVKLEYLQPGTTNIATISRETLPTYLLLEDLNPATSYRVRIQTTDGIYWSEAPLLNSRFITPPATPGFLPAPTGIKRVGGTNEFVVIDWQYSANNTAFFLPEYRLRGGNTNSDWISLPRTRERKAQLTNVPPNTKVDFRVKASTGWQNSVFVVAESLYAYPLISTNTPPPAVLITTNSASSTTMGLVWRFSGNYTNFYTYEVQMKVTGNPSNDWQVVGVLKTNRLFVTHLQPSTAYDVRVRARWGELYGVWKEGVQPFSTAHKDALIFTAPGPITVTNITSTNAVVSWGPSYGPDGINLVYELEGTYSVGNNQPTRQVFGLFTGTNVLVNLKPGYTYSLQVRARYGTGTSVWFNASRLFTTPLPASEQRGPTPPQSLRVTNLSLNSAILEWDPSTDPNNDPITYTVHLIQDRATRYTTSSTRLAIEELVPDTRYGFSVSAVGSPGTELEFAL